MTERIRELAEQAHEYVASSNAKNLRKVFEMKFAELIVRECLLKANGAKIRGETINELIERIKDDFGVE